MRESRCMSLLPRTTLHSDSEHLRSLHGGCRLQDFVNSTGKFNSIVVKSLKLVLCFSHDGVPLIFKKKLADTIAEQYGFFQPGFNPC